MGSPSNYDLFISYHWRDHEAIEQLARALTERGLRVFLDRWYLRPGHAWQTELEAVLSRCRAVAVMLGPEGMGSWQLREQAFALDRQAQAPQFPVIPVLLPGADPPLGFLRLNTWVDLRSGIREERLDLLAAAARGETPAEGALESGEAARAAVCPFRGLLPFREADAEFFCGREAYAAELVDAVRQRSLVAVVGASGSGKSSVARAGLLPALRRGAAGGPWELAVLVPSAEPLRSLAATILPLIEPDLRGADRLAEVRKLATKLAAAEVPLRDPIRDILDRQPGTRRFCLLVDQWEELYTLCKDERQHVRFIDELLDASANGPLTVVLTLRGDFMGEALRHRPLADRLSDAVRTLGPMKREELARAITEPAEKVGLRFQGRLVERMLDEVGEEPGNLPLLEFVLAQLWEQRQGKLLLTEAYDAMKGGVARSQPAPRPSTRSSMRSRRGLLAASCCSSFAPQRRARTPASAYLSTRAMTSGFR